LAEYELYTMKLHQMAQHSYVYIYSKTPRVYQVKGLWNEMKLIRSSGKLKRLMGPKVQ
jgi:hypothetical protein